MVSVEPFSNSHLRCHAKAEKHKEPKTQRHLPMWQLLTRPSSHVFIMKMSKTPFLWTVFHRHVGYQPPNLGFCVLRCSSKAFQNNDVGYRWRIKHKQYKKESNRYNHIHTFLPLPLQNNSKQESPLLQVSFKNRDTARLPASSNTVTANSVCCRKK